MHSLRDRSVLVTGASSGIGTATARALAAEGARPVLAARRRDRLEALAAEIDGAEVLPLDVTDREGVAAALAGRTFDAVVANAGLARGVAPIHEADPADWEETIDVNVKGLLFTVRACLPAMLERGTGDVLLLGSVAGRQVYPGGNVYCASKWAVRAVYEALRMELGGTGLRFTTVDPGMVRTDFALVRHRGDEARAAATYEGFSPLEPEDVADAIVFALSRPPHVNIGEIVMWSRDQASTTQIHRRSE